MGKPTILDGTPPKIECYINDLHATMLHQFGLDHLKLTHRFQGRDYRLTDVGGRVIPEWLA